MKLRIVDVEVPLPAIPPSTCGQQWVLLRLHAVPFGMLEIDRAGCTPAGLGRLILEQHDLPLVRHLLADGHAGLTSLADLAQFTDCPRRAKTPGLRVTVAVCTRNRAAQLPECLDSLAAIDYPADLLDVVVIDNAPTDDSTRMAVAGYPGMRYVRELRPGLDWARNRAVLGSESEIVAFTDDDVSVDPGWVRAIVRAFGEEPHAMCVTGLVVPDEIDTAAQLAFERYGGFGRGFRRDVFRVDVEGGEPVSRRYGGTGRFGTGANMAFRRCFFDEAGLFDPALDVGTVSNGGGDLEMFFRVLKTGHSLVYEPAALVRHRHRRDEAALKVQIANNGVGLSACLVRTAGAYPDEQSGVVRLWLWWLWWWHARRLLHSLVRPGPVPRGLILAELKGACVGLRRYRAARRRAVQILRQYGEPRERGSS